MSWLGYWCWLAGAHKRRRKVGKNKMCGLRQRAIRSARSYWISGRFSFAAPAAGRTRCIATGVILHSIRFDPIRYESFISASFSIATRSFAALLWHRSDAHEEFRGAFFPPRRQLVYCDPGHHLFGSIPTNSLFSILLCAKCGRGKMKHEGKVEHNPRNSDILFFLLIFLLKIFAGTVTNAGEEIIVKAECN